MRKVALSLVLIFAIVMAVSFQNSIPVNAMNYEYTVIDDDFSGMFNTDNWWLSKTQGTSITQVSNGGALKGGSWGNRSYLYSAKPYTIPDGNDVIIEFDLVDAVGGSGTYFTCFRGNFVDANGNIIPQKLGLAVEETVWGKMGTLSSRDGRVLLANTISSGIPSSGYTQVKGGYLQPYNQDGSAIANNAWNKGMSDPGRTYKLHIKSDGSAEVFTKSIGSSNYGFLYKVNAGSHSDVSGTGYIGFGFHGTAVVTLDNVIINAYDPSTQQTTEVFKEDFNNGISADWKTGQTSQNFTGLIFHSYNYLNFNNPGADDALFLKPNLQFDRNSDNYAVIEAKLSIEELDTKSFGLIAGSMLNTDLLTTKDGLYYFEITKSGEDLKLGLKKSVAENNAVVLSEVTAPVDTGKGLGDEFILKFVGRLNGSVDVYVDSTKLGFFTDQGGIFLNGRPGFCTYGDQGTASIHIKNIKVKNTYERAAAGVDIYEGFEGADGEGAPWIDDSKLWLQTRSAGVSYDTNQGLYIENGELVFDNAGHNSWLATKQKYGNFMLQFDITDMVREAIIDDDGNVVNSVMSSWFGIAYGLSNYNSGYAGGQLIYLSSPLKYHPDYPDDEFRKIADLTKNTTIGTLNINPKETVVNTGLRHNLLDPIYDGKTITVRLTAIDGTVTLSYCIRGVEDFNTAINTAVYKATGINHYGNIGITVTSDSARGMAGNCKVDNFIVRNLDNFPDIIIVDKPEEPKTGEEPQPSPSPTPKTPVEQEKNGCKSYLADDNYLLLGGLMLVGVIIFKKRKEKNY